MRWYHIHYMQNNRGSWTSICGKSEVLGVDGGLESYVTCPDCKKIAEDSRRVDNDTFFPIGYLVYGHFFCASCCYGKVHHDRRIPIYRVNIGDYKQTCYLCDATIVEGKTPVWPILFAHQAP